MKYALTFAAALVAAPALAQDDAAPEGGQMQAGFPSEQACQAVSERVQLSLSRADQALQNDEAEGVSQWMGAAADYTTVYETFCDAYDTSGGE